MTDSPDHLGCRTIERLKHDLIAVAGLTDVEYCEHTLDRVLHRFADGWTRRSVQLRSTTRPRGHRELCFRYLDFETGNRPLDVALQTGELRDTGHPIDSWLRWVDERFPSIGHGVDFEVKHGLQKIWHFLAHAHEPRAFLELPQMPRTVGASLPLLRELHLDSVTIVGVDYLKRSINLYFRPTHPDSGGGLLAGLCDRLGWSAPTAEALAHADRSGCVAITFDWDSPRIERVCFYVSGFRRDDVPGHHPLLRRFAAEAPALVADPQFVLGWSHGQNAAYFKIEDDYTGDVTDLFARSMGVDRAPVVPAGAGRSPGPGHDLRQT